jgi:hypothetical protein
MSPTAPALLKSGVISAQRGSRLAVRRPTAVLCVNPPLTGTPPKPVLGEKHRFEFGSDVAPPARVNNGPAKPIDTVYMS